MKSRYVLACLMLTLTFAAEAQVSALRPLRRPTVDVVEKEKPAEVKEEPKKEEATDVVVVNETEAPKEEPKQEEPVKPEEIKTEAPQVVAQALSEEPKKEEPKKEEPKVAEGKEQINAKCGGDAKCPERNSKEEAQKVQDQKVCSDHYAKLRFYHKPESGFQEKWIAKCVATRENRRDGDKLPHKELKLQKALRAICESKIPKSEEKPSKEEAKKEESKEESKEVSKEETKISSHEKHDKLRNKKIKQCMKTIAKLDLDDKKEKKEDNSGKGHLKQCTFSLGVSLDCPEGSYRYQGDSVAKELNNESRDAIKVLEGKKPEARTALPVSVRK